MNTELQRGLELTVIGMGIVFLVLWLIAAMVGLMRLLDERWQRREREEETRVDRPPTLDATTAVIIAAAVATVVAGRHRVRSVRLLQTKRSGETWAAYGRAVLQGSHVITKRTR